MAVWGVDSVTNEHLFTNAAIDFTYASKSLSILIQTDKAIYQPGQTGKHLLLTLKPILCLLMLANSRQKNLSRTSLNE